MASIQYSPRHRQTVFQIVANGKVMLDPSVNSENKKTVIKLSLYFATKNPFILSF